MQEFLGAGVTSFDAGNIILGGDGSDIIGGRGGDISSTATLGWMSTSACAQMRTEQAGKFVASTA